MKKKLSFWERIFGFYNESRHRVICLFGLKIKIRSRFLILRNRVAALEVEKVALHKALDIQRLNHKELSCKHTAFEDKVSDLMQAYEGRLRAYVADIANLTATLSQSTESIKGLGKDWNRLYDGLKHELHIGWQPLWGKFPSELNIPGIKDLQISKILLNCS